MNYSIYKYPKTYHLEGSGMPKSKKAKDKIPFKAIASRHLVVEEKMDGANVAISFNDAGELLLQSRGHYLIGDERTKHFSLFKQWAYNSIEELYLVLGDRYILYGEWLYAKHTIFYNNLDSYFLEYDVLDRETEEFLDTLSRHRLLQDLAVASVPVLYSGIPNNYQEITSLVGQSKFITTRHIETLKTICQQKNLNLKLTLQQTDTTTLMEGLYIKVEENGIVCDRYKYIRKDFITTILNSGGHWLDRPIIPNQLKSSR